MSTPKRSRLARVIDKLRGRKVEEPSDSLRTEPQGVENQDRWGSYGPPSAWPS